MILPFEITLHKKLILNSTVEPQQILALIKKTAFEESRYLKKMKIAGNNFSFKVDFWGVGRGNYFDGVSKGMFCLSKGTEKTTLSYTYRIGSSMVIIPLFLGIPFVIVLIKDFKKYISMLPAFLITLFCVWVLFWFIGLIKMKSLFNLITNKIESEYTT